MGGMCIGGGGGVEVGTNLSWEFPPSLAFSQGENKRQFL